MFALLLLFLLILLAFPILFVVLTGGFFIRTFRVIIIELTIILGENFRYFVLCDPEVTARTVSTGLIETN